MASAAIATNHAKRCSGDLTVLRKPNIFTEADTRDIRRISSAMNSGTSSPARQLWSKIASDGSSGPPACLIPIIADEEVPPYVLTLADSCAAYWDRTAWGWNWSPNGCHPQPRSYQFFGSSGGNVND